ncbi:hypothetical protein F5146DRAFT_1004549 [Armillaria mellea]|nr:hypothetical protein F5146DRAFT_1004549 [Armillaria mellea]
MVIDLNIISSLGAGQNHLLEEEGDLMAAESDAVIEWGVKLVNINILATQFELGDITVVTPCYAHQASGTLLNDNVWQPIAPMAEVSAHTGSKQAKSKCMTLVKNVWLEQWNGFWVRIQLNVQCVITEDGVFPNVKRVILSEIWPMLDLAIIAEDKPTVGQLMTVLTTAGLDTIQMGSNCAACCCWVFRALKAFVDVHLIRDNWQRLASQWNDDVVQVAGKQGAGVMEEDILSLGDWVGFVDSLHYGSATNFLPALRKFFHRTYERLYTLL